MRAVVSRVSHARVIVQGTEIAAIGSGLLGLVGVATTDGSVQARWLARKLAGVRILRGDRSLADSWDCELLIVSQFTLCGDVRAGRRPSWSAAASRRIAEPLITELITTCQQLGVSVKSGQFGAEMVVESSNDGPFTLVIDTPAPAPAGSTNARHIGAPAPPD